MDNKAFYNMTYGVFMLSTKHENMANGCIINTCVQVANSPARVAISLLNANYTCELLKKSGLFAVSVLDETATYETIKHWGLQSGKTVNKLAGLDLEEDANGIPHLSSSTCAVLSCKVVELMDLGTHTIFIGEVLDAKVTGGRPPLTYADYQNRVKPKPQPEENNRRIKGWKCKICGYIYEGAELPEDFTCPICGHAREDFEPIFEN